MLVRRRIQEVRRLTSRQIDSNTHSGRSGFCRLDLSCHLWVIFAFQVIPGILLLANRYVPLALALLARVIVNILTSSQISLPLKWQRSNKFALRFGLHSNKYLPATDITNLNTCVDISRDNESVAMSFQPQGRSQPAEIRLAISKLFEHT
jgi:hypothetical protein